MSKRAEERAMEVYPIQMEYCPERDLNEDARAFFQEGYELAEQDFAPIVQTAICLYESWQCGAMDEIRRYIIELGHLVQPIEKGGYND